MREQVAVKLLTIEEETQDPETYVLALSSGRRDKERAMRRRRLKRLWKRLHELQRQAPRRDQLLLKLGAAKKEAGRAYALVKVRIPKKDEPVTPKTFAVTLNRRKLRLARRREGRYLLRTNLANDNPAQLWAYYIQLTEVEHAFKELKAVRSHPAHPTADSSVLLGWPAPERRTLGDRIASQPTRSPPRGPATASINRRLRGDALHCAGREAVHRHRSRPLQPRHPPSGHLANMDTADSLHACQHDLRALLDEAGQIAGLESLDFTAERELLERLREQQDRPLGVAVLGEFNSGKSTFINAILGQDLLPAKFIPSTRQVMRISHRDGPGQVVVADADADPADAPTPRPLSREAILQLADTGRPLHIETPIRAPWSDLVIYDTPGVNDATTMAESVIFDLMDKVDVVVLMLRAQQALTASEAEFLGQLVRQKDLDKFFFNINFCDALTANSAASVRTHVVKTLAALRNWPIKALGERVFLCAARQTLDAATAATGPAALEHPNQHEQLLAAVHGFAAARKQVLLRDAGDNLLRTLVESAVEKLSAAIAAASDEDARQGQAILQITQAITDFRVSIREEELALRGRILDAKAMLIRQVGEAFDDIGRESQSWLQAARLDELAGDAPGKWLRVALEDRLTPLLAQFRADLDGAFGDLDQRILPAVAHTSARIEGIRKDFDLGPLLAGASIATAGYAVVTVALPWVLGAGGALAVTAGLASLIPGAGVAIGALIGVGLRGAATGVFSALSGAASGYRWIRDATRNWQAQQTRAAYSDQLAGLITDLRHRVTTHLDKAIDPARIMSGVIAARFPEALALEERRLVTARLDRNQLRNGRQDLEDLRARFIATGPS